MATRTRTRSYNGLEVLYDDGYQTAGGFDDYFEAVADLVRHDRDGPPCWFCPVECRPVVADPPVLFFLPGVDGIGLGLFMHHTALGRIFEIRCMHIPVRDRTPLEELVTFVEDAVRFEHPNSPNKPIYLMAHSFGGCLALAIAARNPHIDIILVLSNPATSFGMSQVQPLLPIFKYLSNREDITVTYLLSLNFDIEVKAALNNIENGVHPLEAFNKSIKNLTAPMQISCFLDKLPRDTFSWKVGLVNSAAHYANSHLHAVEAEVLVLARSKTKKKKKNEKKICFPCLSSQLNNNFEILNKYKRLFTYIALQNYLSAYTFLQNLNSTFVYRALCTHKLFSVIELPNRKSTLLNMI